MNEKSFKKQLLRGLEEYSEERKLPYHWQLHEDARSVGLPDISYGVAGVNGWIEAKYSDKNFSPSTAFNPPFEPFQEAWLVARGQAAGRADLVWGFRDGHLIVPWDALLSRILGATTTEELLKSTRAGFYLGKFNQKSMAKLVDES